MSFLDKQRYLDAVASGQYSDAAFNPPAPAAPALPRKPSGVLRRTVGDTSVGLLQGAMGVGEMALGLGNLATAGMLGRATDAAGLTGQGGAFDRARGITEEWYSPEAQAARQEVAAAEGFVDTLGAYLSNPTAIQTDAASMVPLMGAGGAAARVAKAAMPRLAGRTAGAIGEGAVAAGAIAEDIRSQDPENILGMYAAVPAGVGTALVSRHVGKSDIETAIATRGAEGAATGGLVRRAAGGFTSEGAQELLQSSQEQMWTNLGTGAPLMDGVAKAAASGMLLGGVSGAVVGSLIKPPAAPTADAPTEDLAAAVDQRLLGLPAPHNVMGSGRGWTDAEWATMQDDAEAASTAPLALPAPAAGTVEPGTRPAYAESVELPGGVQQMYSFPDGSVGTPEQVEQYIAKQLRKVPADKRDARRVELMAELLKSQDAPTSPEQLEARARGDAELAAFAKAAKSMEGTAKQELRTAEQRLLAEFDSLSARAREVGVPEAEVPAPIGELKQDRAMPAQGRVMLARQHVAKLQDAIARREAELRAQADRTAGDRAMDAEQRRAAALVAKITPTYPQAQPGGALTQTEETQDAVQEPSTAEVPVQPEAGVGTGVGEQVRAAEAAAAQVEPQAQPEARAVEAPGEARVDVEVAPAPKAKKGKAAKTRKRVADMSDREFISAMEANESAAQRAWDEDQRVSDADPTFEDLHDSLKDEWVMAYIDAQAEGDNTTGPSDIAEKLMERYQRTRHNRSARVVEDEVDDLGDWPARHTNEGVTNPTTVQAVRMAVADLVPSPEQHLTVVADVTDLPADIQAIFADGRAAAYVPGHTRSAGRAYIVANRLNKGEERGVYLHEVGVHAAMPADVVHRLSERVRLWAAGASGVFEEMHARRVMETLDKIDAARVRAGNPKMNDALRRHEEVAYFVQRMVDAGVDPTAARQPSAGLTQWFRELITAMRAALKKLWASPDNITPQDVVDLAYGMAARLNVGAATPNKPADFAGAAPAFLRNPTATPVGSGLTELLQTAKGVVSNARVRRALLGWASMHHLHKLYGGKGGAWGEAFNRFWRVLQLQDGRMNQERVNSTHAEALFHEFENLKSVRRAARDSKGRTVVQQVYEFMRDTSQRRIDPRFQLSADVDSGGMLLRAKEQQPYWKAAKDEITTIEAAIAQAKSAGKTHEQLDRDLIAAKEHLSGVETALSQLNQYYAELGRAGQVNGVNVQANYLDGYRAAARDWAKFGQILSEDGKSRKVVHELYDTVERRLKQLGRMELDSSVRSWYNMLYAPERDGKPVAKEAKVAAMLKQMKAGELGPEAKAFATQMDISLLRMYRGPYFHSARWGDFYVRYKDETGETVREHFESESDWKAAQAELAKAEKAGEISELEAGYKGEPTGDSTTYRQLQAMIAKAEENLKTRPDMTEAEIAAAVDLVKGTLSRAYIDLLPETSTRSARLMRRNIKGASAEMRRAFAKRAEAAHLHIAMAEYMPQLNAELRSMQAEAKIMAGTGREGEEALRDPEMHVIATQVNDEVRKRMHDLATQPETPLFDLASSVNYTFYLAANPAYLLSNLLQPYQFAAIIGAKYGVVKSARRVASQAGKAYRILKEAGHGRGDFFNPHLEFSAHLREAERTGSSGGLTLNEWKMLDMLNKRGKLDVTLARGLGAMSRTQTQDATAYDLGEKVRAIGAFGHYTEAQNRISSALAAYDLATKEGKLDHEAAAEYASDMVDETHLNYAGINTARQIGKHGFVGAATPLVMAFKRYQFQVLELHMRMIQDAFAKDPAKAAEARKQLRGMMALTGVLAGTMGLPFATVLFAVANAFGDEEDERAGFRRAVDDAFGPELGAIFTNGLPRAVGADLQGNIGMHDLLPLSRFMADRRELQDRLPSLITDSTGAFSGMAQNALTGAAKVLDGNVIEGLKEMMPKVVSGAIAGTQLAVEGKFRDHKGNLLPMDASAWDAMLTGLNIRPGEKADRDMRNRMLRSEEYLVGKKLASIRKDYVEARQTGDAEAAREAMMQLLEFNQEHPEHAVRPQELEVSFRSRVKEGLVAQATGTGIMAQPSDIPVLRRYQWGETGE